MSRQGRLDFPGAIHLIQVEGHAAGSIFFDAAVLREYPDNPRAHARALQCWEYLMVRACDRYDALLHAYKWLPNAAILLLQRSAVPLEIILATVLGQFSRQLHASGMVAQHCSPYRSRYRSIVVARDSLPYAVRHVVWHGADAEPALSPIDYPFCSYALHCTEGGADWLSRADFVTAIRQRGYVGRKGCEQFLRKRESHRHRVQFSEALRGRSRIIGETIDVEEAIPKRDPRAIPSLGQIIEAVAVLLQKALIDERDGVLGRALTTWYATRSGAATLRTMGQRFHRSPTTLRRDIESHRAARSELFAKTLEELLAATARPGRA